MVTIRPYSSGDREAVRRICFTTGYMGEPIDWQWRDAVSFADLFTGYYTDCEPESASVAEVDGRVVGYLLGCRDTAAAGNPVGALGHHIARRGLLFRPGTAGVLWRAIGDIAVLAAKRSLPSPGSGDPRWPAHLHIDLLPEARGHGVGSLLIHRWLDDLGAAGIAGCHLETWAENADARAFFAATGFRDRGRPAPMPGVRDRHGGRHHSQLMTIDLGV